MRFAALRLLVRAAPILVATFALALAAWVTVGLPSVTAISTVQQPSIMFVDRHGLPLYEASGGARQQPVALHDIAPVVISATIAVEDSSFYSHWGVDPRGVLRAAWSTLNGQPAGGSTITQQLVRNTVLSPEERSERSIRRKLREIILAVEAERTMTKDDILAAYLNTIPYGNRAVGIEAASQAYFGKPASQLDLAEAVMLAGLPQAPTLLDPLTNLDAAKERQHIVLGRLVAHGDVTQQEADRASAEHLALSSTGDPITAPHFVLGARDEAAKAAHALGGTRVVTTLDAGLQHLAEDTIRRHLDRLKNENVTNAALVAIDPATGEILALAGSADYFDASIDGAVNIATSPRQPGSSIKPLTYAAAFERGYSPASVLNDVRTVFQTRKGETYIPVNYDHLYHGPMSLRTALASSINVVAVALLNRIGVGALMDLGHEMGLTTWQDPDRYDLSLTLGGGEVNLLELTSAYGAFANGGKHAEPQDVLRIEAADGTTLWQPRPSEPRQVVSPETAYLVSDVLSDSQARVLGFGAQNPLAIGRPAAVKTGTTSSFKDNWTIGYTPQLVVGVWVGNADGQPMTQVSGVTGAAPIWHDFMVEALKNAAPLRFIPPDDIVWEEVCETDGLLPSPACPRRTLEPFAADTVPTQVSTSYVQATINVATGELAAPGCNGPVVERTFWIVPPDALAWARDNGIPALPDTYCSGTAVQTGGSAQFVQLVEPDDGAQFQLSARLPLDSQRLQIRALARGGSVQLAVDGSPIATRGETEGWWTLTPGVHTVSATLFDHDAPVREVHRTITVTGASAPWRPDE